MIYFCLFPGKFLLGSALLDMGETHKAVDLLVDASVGLRTEQRGRREPFLETIVGTSEEYSENRLLVTYLLKVCFVKKSSGNLNYHCYYFIYIYPLVAGYSNV